MGRVDSLFSSDIVMYRVLGILLSFGCILTAVLESSYYDRGFWDTTLLSIMTVGMIAYSLISFLPNITSKHMLIGWWVLLGIGIPWEGVHIYEQNLSYIAAMPVYVHVGMMFASMKRVQHLRWLLAYCVPVISIAAFITPNPEIPPMFYAMGILVLSLYVYFVMVTNIRLREQQQLTESSLRQNQQLLESAQRIARIGGWEYHREKGLFWTNELWDLAELSPSPDSSGASFNILPLEAQTLLQENIEKVLSGVIKEFEIDTTMQAGSGEVLDVRILGELHLAHRDVVIGTLQDVTYYVEKERLLTEAREAAENAAKTRSQFLANMSHEIRTPLNGVIGMTALLKSKDLEKSQQVGYLNILNSSSEVLLSVINSILDFSKIDSGQIKLESHRFNLESCLAESIDVVMPQANSKNLDIVFDWDLKLPTFFKGDSSRIRQVVINLLSNAIKFTNTGEVRLRVRADEEADENRLVVKISVEDSGIGISKQQRASIFDAFVQEDASTTRKFGGTGLGLSISKQLITLMGGEITLDSKLERGSKFHVILPLQKENHEALQSYDRLRDKRALILDTDPTKQQVVAQLLQQLEMKFSVSTTVKELNELLILNNNYDLIILDYSQSDMTLTDLAERIRSYLKSKIPLMLLSSIDNIPSSEQLFDLSLVKPIRPLQLANSILSLFSVTENEAMNQPVLANKINHQFSYRTLVAEDNLVNQKVALGLLSKLGIAADFVSNGQEALNRLDEQHYDVVFMDVQMPLVDGLEAARRIRSNMSLQQPHIVAMTANAMAEDRAACLEAGMDDYLSKPIRLESLAEALRNVTASTRSKRSSPSVAHPSV